MLTMFGDRSIVRKVGKEGIIYIDIDGCLMPQSEHARAVAYAALLKKATGEEQDVSAVHNEWAGPPVDLTIEAIRKKYGLKEELKTLLREHDEEYIRLVEKQEPNPYILQVLEIAKAEKIKLIFLSNGRDNGVKAIFKRLGIDGLNKTVFAYDSKRRIILGERVRDKVEYLRHYAGKKCILSESILAFEDNDKTAEKLEKFGAKVVYVFNGHNKADYVPASTNICLECAEQPKHPGHPVAKKQRIDLTASK